MNSEVENTLPIGWKETSLGEISDFKGGSQPPKSQFIFKDKKGYVRFLQIRDFASDKNITFIPVSSKNRLCSEDDILLGRYGASVGKVLTGKTGAYNVAVMKTYPDLDIIDKRFFFLYLCSNDFQSTLLKVTSRRAAQAGFSKQDISAFPFPLPPLYEQKHIAAKIDTLFAKIDKAISLTEESLVQAKNLLTSAVKMIFEDGEFKGWKKLKFKEFASLRHGHQFRKYDFVENGIPVVKIGQCKPGNWLDLTKCNFIDKSRELEFSNDLICKGDLLMALTGGTLGKVTWVKDDYGVIVQNYRVGNFFTNEKLSSKRFLMYALLSPIFQTLMYSKINVAAQPNIGKEEIENLEFSLPSLEEQSKIVDRLDDVTFKTKQTESKLEEQLAYLKQLKSSILSKAFKGKL